jgi:hypothetical protein
MSPKLIQLFQEMADLTEPKCRQCRAPQSCCSPEYCGMAFETAAEHGVTLQATGHERLPLMGPTGCTAPPWTRPLCTFHVCSINSLGFDPKDATFTKEYFKLRSKIEKREYRESLEQRKTH